MNLGSAGEPRWERCCPAPSRCGVSSPALSLGWRSPRADPQLCPRAGTSQCSSSIPAIPLPPSSGCPGQGAATSPPSHPAPCCCPGSGRDACTSSEPCTPIHYTQGDPDPTLVSLKCERVLKQQLIKAL